MAQILWTPQASTELEDILYFIRVNGDRPLTAQRLGEELIEIIGQLAEGSLKGIPTLPLQQNGFTTSSSAG